MSIIEVLLSRKEVMLSLALVGLVLLIAFALAVGPSIYDTGKRIMARRKTRRAAALALKKKNARRKRPAQAKTAPGTPRPVVAAASAPLQLAEAIGAPLSDAPVEPLENITIAVTAETPPEVVVISTTEAVDDENASIDLEAESDLQSLLDSVFTNDEMNARYDVLLRDSEPVSAETLLAMARKVAASLRIQNNYQADRNLR